MKANIGDEDENGVGLRVIDNNGVSHGIHVGFDGEITYHEQDGYPDKPSKRTEEGAEHIEQARKYAKWYVYRQRGYDTVPAYENPDRIAAVGGVVGNLSTAQFEDYFGEYYEQFRYHLTGEGYPPVEIPSEVGDQTFLFYRLGVYLDLDEDILADEDVQQYFGQATDHLSAGSDLVGQLTDLAEQLDVTGTQPFELDTVSDLELVYQHAGDEQQVGGSNPRTREPDTRLELTPVDPGGEEYLSMEGFQTLITHHLLCQVRDCYLTMGLEPPESYRVLGMGQYEATMRYEHRDVYDKYHHVGSDIHGYFDFESSGPFDLGGIL